MANIIKVLFLLTLIPAHSFAAKPSIAKVLMARGKVTVLLPGAHEAVKLKKGMGLPKDSSILVEGKGFAKIKFINDSFVTLGPNSKMIVEMDQKDNTSLVSLVTGKIRAAVKKNKDGKKDKKFLVKTNAAVMGVRGTEFQVTFNPASLRSSLLTYEGQVDIKKQELKDVKELSQKSSDKVEKIKKLLEQKPQPVKKGDFTNIALGQKKVIRPVKINPAQFVLLRKDESLGVYKKKITQKEKLDLQAEVKKLEKEFRQELSTKKEKSAIKDLGFLDSETGFYVPPAGGKRLVGKVSTNGEYIPPKGAKIDAKKGLVLEADAPEETVELVKKVEKDIKVQADVEELDPRYRRYLMTN